MDKKEFDSFDEAEAYLTEHKCEFAELKMPCCCIVKFPCKRCSRPMVKTGAQTTARMGSLCPTCGGVIRAEIDGKHVSNREWMMKEGKRHD